MKKGLSLFGYVVMTFFLLAGVCLAGESVFYYHTDPAGTPLAMTDVNGIVVWRADYKPFGEENSINPQTKENDMRFVGKEKDKETGLQYFGARYMKDEIGRFISPDPVGPVDPRTSKTNYGMLTNPQKMNRYAYSLNNPYRYVDPDGRIIEIIGTESEKKTIQRDINRLRDKSPTGKTIIEKLENSKETIKIKITDSGNSYDPSNRVIEYNPEKEHISSGKEKWHYRNPEVALGHEAIHGLHDIGNELGATREIEESQTVGLGKFSNKPYTENKIRAEYGLERRPEY